MGVPVGKLQSTEALTIGRRLGLRQIFFVTDGEKCDYLSRASSVREVQLKKLSKPVQAIMLKKVDFKKDLSTNPDAASGNKWLCYGRGTARRACQ